MRRTDFLNMIGGKVPIDRNMIREILELIGVFPYFQSAHLLLLKGLYENGDVKFENQLRTSAIHIADREVLYYLLHDWPFNEEENEKTENKPDNEEDNNSDTQQTVIESARNSNLLINEIEGIAGMGVQGDEDDYLMKNGHNVLISADADNEESAEVIFISENGGSATDYQPFYSDPGISGPEDAELLELDNISGGNDSGDDADQLNFMPGKAVKGVNKQEQAELIDKFIIANPRIEPSREKTNTPVEDIPKSLSAGEGGFLTETLARIYVTQGYYSKAIDIYEKLSLKYPEKSSYFASQIEKVKEYLKK